MAEVLDRTFPSSNPYTPRSHTRNLAIPHTPSPHTLTTPPHTPSLNPPPPPTSSSPTSLPLAILCLSKLVNNKQQNQLLAARGVGEGVCLRVVPSVRGTLKCKDMVLDDRDVLIVIEGAVKPIRCEITEDQMMSVWRVHMGEGNGEAVEGEDGWGGCGPYRLK